MHTWQSYNNNNEMCKYATKSSAQNMHQGHASIIYFNATCVIKFNQQYPVQQ